MKTKFDLHLRYHPPPTPDWRSQAWTCIDDLTHDIDSYVGIGPTPLAAVTDYLDQLVDLGGEDIAPEEQSSS